MQNRNVFALLIGVGNYEEVNIANLPTYRMDLSLIGAALESGLKVPHDNIRFMAGKDNDGFISTTDLAHAMADFQSKLGSEDIFIFYFSGHGRNKNIIFSNGQVELQSVVDYIDRLHAKSKLVILDCCYSGNFKGAGARIMTFEEYMADFAGRGIAVMASSSADEVSRLGPNDNHSMFTGALSSAITLNRNTRKGRISLDDIYEGMIRLVKAWNANNPGKEQQPVFRSSIGGTIFFQVEDYKPYQQLRIEYEEEKYKVIKVEPLSSPDTKRLSAFVVTREGVNRDDLPEITKEIAEHIKYAEVYSGKNSEMRFEGTPARAVWCYFGHDESDIINSTYYSYTIWAADDEIRSKFFRENKNTSIIDDICIFENNAYDMIKKMQAPRKTREEFIESNRRLLALIVSMAERFIYDLQEVNNQTRTMEEIKEEYGEWIDKVQRRYIELSDEDIAPDDLHEWSEEIMNLAGWVVNLSLALENKAGGGKIGDREEWLMKDAIRHYHESMDKLKNIEDDIDWEEAP